MPITRREFVERLRDTLPHKYRTLSDDALLSVVAQQRPEFANYEFAPEPAEAPGLVGGFTEPIREQWARKEQTAAGAYASIVGSIFDQDNPIAKTASDWYNSAAASADAAIADDYRLKEYQKWAGENPFSWGEFFTNPSMFSSTFSSVASSMMATVGAGTVAGLLTGGNPAAVFGATFATGYTLESSEAYREAKQRATEKGLSENEINELAAESGLMYGIGAGILESLVPFSVAKSMGFVSSNMLGKYAAKYLDEAVELGGKGSVEAAERAFRKIAQDGVSKMQRLRSVAGFSILESGGEALTEATQYLYQKAVLDTKLDGSDINGEWLAEAMSTPEFHQSIAGGLMGGGVFSAPGAILKASGKKGQKAADAYTRFVDGPGAKLSDEAKSEVLLKVLNGLDGPVERAKFVSGVDRAVSEKVTGDVIESIKSEEAKQADAAPAEQEQPAPKKKFSMAEEVVSEPGPETQPTESPQGPSLEDAIKPKAGSSRMQKILKPQEHGEARDVPNQDPADKLFYYMAASDEANKDFEKLSPEEQSSALDLLAASMKKFGAPEDLLYKDGKPNKEYIGRLLANIRKQGLRPFTFETGGIGSEKKSALMPSKHPYGKEYKSDFAASFDIEDLDKESRRELFADAQEELAGAGQTKRTGKYADINKINKLGKSIIDAVGSNVGKVTGTYKQLYQQFEKVKSDFRKHKNPDRLVDDAFALLKPHAEKYGIDLTKDSMYKEAKSGKSSKPSAKPASKSTVDKAAAPAPNSNKVDSGRKRKPEKPAQPQEKPKAGNKLKYSSPAIMGGAELEVEVVKDDGKTVSFNIIAPFEMPGLSETKSEFDAKLVMSPSAAKPKQRKTPASLSVTGIGSISIGDSVMYADATTNEGEPTVAILSKIEQRERAGGKYDVYAFSIDGKELPAIPLEWARERVISLVNPEPATPQKTIDEIAPKSINTEEPSTGDQFNQDGMDEAFQLEPGISQSANQAILERLQKQFPFIGVQSVSEIITRDGRQAVGSAFGALVKYVESKAGLDTLPHEYFHIYVNMFGGDPIIKRAIAQYGSEEAFVQAVGEYYANRFTGNISKLKSLLKRIIARLKQLIGKANKEDLTYIIGERFYTDTVASPQDTTFERADEKYKEENDDDGDGTAQDETEENPWTVFDKLFLSEYGIYITKKTYERIIRYIHDNRGRSFISTEEFSAFQDGLIELIKKAEGIKRDIIPSKNSARAIKDLFQKTLSKIDIQFRPKEGEELDPKTALPKRWRMEVILKQLTGGRTIFDTIRMLSKELLTSGKANPDREFMNFIEFDQLNRGIKNKLFYVSAKNFYKHISGTGKKGPYNFFKSARPDEWEITAEVIENLNIHFANEFHTGKVSHLKFFFAEVSGDNSQMILSAVTGDAAKMNPEAFGKYLANELAEGILTREQSEQMWKEAIDRYKGGNIYAIGQAVGWHERAKSIKGKYYINGQPIVDPGASSGATEGISYKFNKPRVKDVPNFYKRIKIDLAKGWIPYGSGNSKIMVVDSSEVTFKLNGEVFNHQKPDGSYGFDGWMMTSKNLMDRFNRVSGKNSYVWKTFVRTLGDNGVDYLGAKMLEMVPFEGTEVFKGDQLIARYKNGTWVDAQGNEFDRLATDDEVKDRDGIYRENYKVHDLPEHATRVMFEATKVPNKGANPVVSYELMLDDDFIKSAEGKQYYDAVINYIDSLLNEYLDEAYGLKDNPAAAAQKIANMLAEGEVPKEIDYAIKADPRALFLPSNVKLLEYVIRNEWIVNGLHKMRQKKKGMATKLYLKPVGPLKLKDPNNIIISGDNTAMLNAVKAEIKKRTGRDTKYGDVIDEIDTINDWLAQNPFYVMTHRQPIQSFTKVQPRRIQEFTHPGHGQTVFLSMNDVFRVHEADHDGDTIFVETFDDKTMLDALRKLSNSKVFNDRNRIVDLSYFKKPPVAKSIVSTVDRLRSLSNNAKTRGAQGMAVNAKTILAVMAFKNVDFKIWYLGPGNKKVVTRVAPYKVTGRTVMSYWPLDREYLQIDENGNIGNQEVARRLMTEGDKIEKASDGNYYLNTTKENEFSILLQAAVDEEKFGLLGSLEMSTKDGKPMTIHDFLITRMFFKDDGPAWNQNQIRAVRKVFNLFNYSSHRKGDNRETGLGYNTEGLLENAREIGMRYFDVVPDKEGNPVPSRKSTEKVISTIYNQAQANYKYTDFRNVEHKQKNYGLESITMNNRVTPMEMLLGGVGIYDQIEAVRNASKGILLQHNPVYMNENAYWYAHAKALKQIEPWLLEMGRAAESDVRNMQVGWKIGAMTKQAHDAVFAEAMAEMESKGISKEEIDRYSIKYDYNVKYKEEFLDKYMNLWMNEMNDAQRAWATINILTGSTTNTSAGVKQVSRLMSLPPAFMLHPQVLGTYARAYYDNLYKPGVTEVESDASKLGTFSQLINKLLNTDDKGPKTCG